MRDVPGSHPEQELGSQGLSTQEGLFLCASVPRVSLHGEVCGFAGIRVRTLGEPGRRAALDS